MTGTSHIRTQAFLISTYFLSRNSISPVTLQWRWSQSLVHVVRCVGSASAIVPSSDRVT